MCWRGLLAGHEARRHGLLVYREERLALGAIEHVEHAGFGGLDDRRHRHTLDFDVTQHGLGGEIVVPEVVVDELLVPDELAAPRIQREERVGEAIAAEPRAAEVVGARGAGRNQHEAIVLVDRHQSPGVRRAGRGGLGEIPFRGRGVRGRVGYRIESPKQRAAAGIEGPDHTALHLGGAVVADRRADDYNIPVDRGRRGDEIGRAVADAQAVSEVDLPVGAEILAGLPCGGIQRQQPGIQRTGQNTSRARTCMSAVGVFPNTHAARARFGVLARSIDVGIESPALHARLRVERDHDVRRGLEIEEAECQHRRRLER